MQKIIINDLKEMKLFANNFAKSLSHPIFIALYGNLGAGKTTFARFLLESLTGEQMNVPSPTFTLVQTYTTPIGEVWHCDLYRLEDPKDVWELGIMDAINQVILLVEWPEKMARYLPQNRLDVFIEIKGDMREIICIS